MSIVTFRRDEIPPASEEELAQLRALADRPDSEIDLSDMPELTDEELAQFVPRAYYRNRVRIDPDVLAWLKDNGKNYHTDVNSILRETMAREGRHAR